jgi:hypothetical protein
LESSCKTLKKLNESGEPRSKESRIKQSITTTISIVGEVYYRLTVLEDLPPLPGKRERIVVCSCSCGGTITTLKKHLRQGLTRSCGCLNREHISALGKDNVKKYRKSQGHPEDVPMSTGTRSDFQHTIGLEVKRRDNFTCVLCGNKPGKLHAHHIETWKFDESKRFDIKNLITLCKPCHLNKVHRGKFREEPDPELTKILMEKIAEIYKE